MAISYEKPMATSLQEAQEIHRLCKQGGVKAVVSHQMKYGPHFRAVRSLISAGKLGRIHTIHAGSKGWMFHSAPHLLDYMMFFSGDIRGESAFGHVSGRSLLSDSHPSPEYMLGVVQFPSGIQGIVETGPPWVGLPDEDRFWFNTRLAIYGELGHAEVTVGQGWRAAIAHDGLLSGPGWYDAEADQAAYVADLAGWLDDGANIHPCNNDISYAGVEILMALIESALQRKRIDMPFEAEGNPVDRMRTLLPAQEWRGTRWE
jgi:predicted dehydrogenase